jgi:hypothetical protein
MRVRPESTGSLIVTVPEFAAKHRLKVSRGIIPGTHDESQIYEYSGDELCVMFITPASKPPRTLFWRRYRDAGIAAGMTLRQNGDAEGCLSFDGTNAEQVRIALKHAGVKRKRRASPKQLANLAKSSKFRQKPPARTPHLPLISTNGSMWSTG